MANYCMYCGKPVQEGAVFCMFCGRPLPKLQEDRPQQTRSNAAAAAPQTINASFPEPVMHTAATIPADQSVPAPKSAGEIFAGELELAGANALNAVKGPVGGIFSGIGAYLSGIIDIFKKKSALAGTVIAAVLWGALWYFRDSENPVVRILSLITYADGGFEDSVAGMIGGTLGKGTVMAAIISLFKRGGLKGLFSGIGALFTGKGEKRGIAGILLGTAAGAALYLIFSGMSLSPSSAAAGIAGTVLSLEALGSGRGKLFELAGSLTSRRTDGIRTSSSGGCYGLLTGLAVGFGLAAALAATGVLEVLT